MRFSDLSALLRAFLFHFYEQSIWVSRPGIILGERKAGFSSVQSQDGNILCMSGCYVKFRCATDCTTSSCEYDLSDVRHITTVHTEAKAGLRTSSFLAQPSAAGVWVCVFWLEIIGT